MILLQAIGITTLLFIVVIGLTVLFIAGIYNDNNFINVITLGSAGAILFLLVVAQVYQDLLN